MLLPLCIHCRFRTFACRYKGAAISALPLSAQTAVFAGIFASLGAATYVNTTILGPAVSAMLPSWLQVTMLLGRPFCTVWVAVAARCCKDASGHSSRQRIKLKST